MSLSSARVRFGVPRCANSARALLNCFSVWVCRKWSGAAASCTWCCLNLRLRASATSSSSWAVSAANDMSSSKDTSSASSLKIIRRCKASRSAASKEKPTSVRSEANAFLFRRSDVVDSEAIDCASEAAVRCLENKAARSGEPFEAGGACCRRARLQAISLSERLFPGDQRIYATEGNSTDSVDRGLRGRNQRKTSREPPRFKLPSTFTKADPPRRRDVDPRASGGTWIASSPLFSLPTVACSSTRASSRARSSVIARAIQRYCGA
mmetsp:Transcript_24210/g.81633  ORF Transcript_24210/g.81633 Transcript_24210/m.81633 type:complete len:266 (+) Transcript_24210:3945-4742(+)